jgi:hypothetical protein
VHNPELGIMRAKDDHLNRHRIVHFRTGQNETVNQGA